MSESEPFLQPFTGVEEQLRSIIEPVIARENLELVVLTLVRSKTQDILRLSVDRPHAGVVPGQGVSMKELEQLNRLLGDMLDVEDNNLKIFKERWELEVGSPGVDRPLTKKSHFKDVLGVKIKARLKQQAKSLVGKLSVADDNGIVVAIDGHDERVDFNDVDHAHVVFEFQDPEKPGKPGKGSKPGKKKK